MTKEARQWAVDETPTIQTTLLGRRVAVGFNDTERVYGTIVGVCMTATGRGKTIVELERGDAALMVFDITDTFLVKE